MIEHRYIYKTDSVGKTRVWYQQQDGARYRTVAGIEGGSLVESGWTDCDGKQGRSAVEQATSEIESAYKHKLSREYHETRDTISAGAHFFKPMLAQKYESVSYPVFAQPKLDGVRCIATKDGMFSREGKPLPGATHVYAALMPLFAEDPDVILDGELYNHAFKDDFNAIVSLVKKANPDPARAARVKEFVQYHVYDMPSFEGTFSSRTLALQMIASIIDNPSIVYVETRQADSQRELDELYGHWLGLGYEGQMVRLNLPYEQKRSKTLLKRKEFIDDEYPVESIEAGQGNWAGVAKSVRCRLPDGRIFGAGIRGTRERAAELLNEDHKVVTVRYFQLTPDGIPRFPIVTKFHGAERTL